MKHLVLGTAGHVDHGKTKLIEALTGTDTDRLPEEKERGITIEPGFARLTLPCGDTFDIVDVPGHEKLIRNMLSGASSIDATLLVVAADEGVMPQTREHLNILSLLGIQRGIVAITKADLADSEQLRLVRNEIHTAVKGTFLENAPVLAVSARTGEGLDLLIEALSRLAAAAPAHASDCPFRLPIDRAFTISGSGLVVTGTLSDGKISVGDSVMLYPAGKPVRIRALQHCGEPADSLHAGMRAAANLTGVEKSEIRRGAMLAESDSVSISDRITVRLTVCRDAEFSVRNASDLHFYLGTQERMCRVRLLSGDVLLPGESGLAQFAFSEPIAVRNRDRFIVRFFSPVITIGGGIVIEAEAARLKRNRPEILARLKRISASDEARILSIIEASGCVPVDAETLFLRSGLGKASVKSSLETLQKNNDLVSLSEGYLARSALKKVGDALLLSLADYHQKNPLSKGMGLSELRDRFLPAGRRASDAVLRYFISEGAIRIDGAYAALLSFTSAYTGERLDAYNALSAFYLEACFLPPTNNETVSALRIPPALAGEVLSAMLRDGTLVALTPTVSMHRNAYREALGTFLNLIDQKGSVTLGEYRTALNISRKYARMILELFDRQKISLFRNDMRTLIKRPDL